MFQRPKCVGGGYVICLEMSANLNAVVSQTVTGLGYVLVEIERSAGGLLRVTIDHPWALGQEAILVAVEDCERVTRQLQYVLEVENVDYKRLEVASPGIDRPLLGEGDFERFSGEVVDLTLKVAIGSEIAAQSVGVVNANRKKFRGTLGKSDQGGWQIVLENEAAKPLKPGAKVSKKRLEAPATVMGFKLDELKEARLAPIVDFKGRRGKASGFDAQA
jgi:ribosome maturation factor RimP